MKPWTLLILLVAAPVSAQTYTMQVYRTAVSGAPFAIMPIPATVVMCQESGASSFVMAPAVNPTQASFTDVNSGTRDCIAALGPELSALPMSADPYVATLTVTLPSGIVSPPSVPSNLFYRTSPLVLTCPADVTASTSGPIAVTYAAPVSGGGIQPASVTCAPASGSVFPIGTTAVGCHATNAAAQTAMCGFTVTVPEPPPPPPSPCTTDPLRITSIKWPAGQTGTRSGQWSSTKPLASVAFKWNPQRLEALDTRGCVATVNR